MKGLRMNIFESLENLNVSEECFDDIINIVEELLDENIKTTIYRKVPLEKRYELLQKADKVKANELADRHTRQMFKNYFENGKDMIKASNDADKQTGADGSHETNKNIEGTHKTRMRNMEYRGDVPYKSGFNRDLKPILNSIRKQVEKREKFN